MKDESAASSPTSVVLSTKPSDCTLDDADLGPRLVDWGGVLSHVDRRVPLDEGVRLELDAATPVGQLAELVAAERSCCNFFRFAITVDTRGVGLEVRTDADHRAVIDGLFESS